MYCHPQIFSDLARGIGVPLRIDQATINGEVGHYARLLVDIDLSTKVPNSIMLNRNGGSFKVLLHYENMPAFCTACSNVGHAVTTCRRLERTGNVGSTHEATEDGHVEKEGTKTPVAYSVAADLPTFNGFGMLADDQEHLHVEDPVVNVEPLVGSPHPRLSWAAAVEEEVDVNNEDDIVSEAEKDKEEVVGTVGGQADIGGLQADILHGLGTSAVGTHLTGQLQSDALHGSVHSDVCTHLAGGGDTLQVGVEAGSVMSTVMVPYVASSPTAQHNLLAASSALAVIEQEDA